MSERNFKILGWFLTAAVVGIGIFSFLAWRAVTVESAEVRAAQAAFAAVRGQYPDQVPLLVEDDEGRFVPHPRRSGNPAAGIYAG